MMKIMINIIIMIIIVRFTIITTRDFEDDGPLSLPVTDRELQRQADSQILRFVLVTAPHILEYSVLLIKFY